MIPLVVPERHAYLDEVVHSDGECGISPDTPAGQFDPDLAIQLIEGA